jgi:predicted GH43/DUF377 family glycosyl hydrolase
MNMGRLAGAAPPGTVPFRLERLGVLMAPLAGEPTEAWGVLNPASAHREGETYLFPRMVAEGNFSRIGRSRVVFDANGTPVDVERLGTALEPEEAWELHAGGGGVEDPRITHLPSLGRWIMTYIAFGPFGPRIGLAASGDLERWERLGPASFGYQADLQTDLGMYPNKDALLFPEPVLAPDGRLAYAMLHRPMWDMSLVLPGEGEPLPAGLADPRPGMWVSFAPADAVEADLTELTRFEQHRLVALCEHPWEALKIGGGTPPIRIDEGWLVLHHGVTGATARGFDVQSNVRYCAGALVLDADDVTHVIARSATPLLEPELPEELTGTVGNVVFPTAIEPAQSGDAWAFDVYYGMADRSIGVARLSRIATEVDRP